MQINQGSTSNLNPGTYILQIKASNNDGIWNINGNKFNYYNYPAILDGMVVRNHFDFDNCRDTIYNLQIQGKPAAGRGKDLYSHFTGSAL